MKITNPNDKKIPIDIINVINKIAYDQIISSRDTIHLIETQVDSETVHVIVLTTHAHQVVLALEKYVYVKIMNVSALIYPNATCHASNVVAQTQTCKSQIHPFVEINLDKFNEPQLFCSSRRSNSLATQQQDFIQHEKVTASNPFSETSIQGIKDNQVSNLNNTNKSNSASHICRFQIPNELLDSMEEKT